MIDNNIYHVKRGNLIVIYPGQIHCFYDIDNVDGAILAFTENFILNSNSTNESSLMFKLLLELENANKYSFEKSNLHNIESIINRINIELTKSYDELQKSFLQNYLCALLLNLTREKMESLKLQDRNQTEVFYGNKFKRLVQENHKKTIMVTNYAKMLGISVRFLQNTTKSLYGKSPKAFIHEYVLLESKKLLMDSNLQVKEISYMMGFDEPTNFTKFFKKYCKVSPNEFRKTIIYH